MPDLTKNYNFKKPKANEYAKPDDFNENFEALDLILKALADALGNLPEAVTIDSELSEASRNPVENKVIYAALALYQKKHIAAAVTLTAAGWSDNSQTISNEKFMSAGYAYTVAPASSSFADYAEAMVYADDVTVDGQMVFHCDSAPTADLTVNIVRMVTAE